jgi:hypothetical protein
MAELSELHKSDALAPGMRNPFVVTKAVDFSDEEIMATWVDFAAEGGFFALANPASPMPRILLGGKGSGRTHLMRYFSAPLQKLRHREDIVGGIRQEGYLGIYLRASGLNSGRFSGKGIDDEVWADVFAYSLDLWLAQLTLSTIGDLFADTSILNGVEGEIGREVVESFDEFEGPVPESLGELRNSLHDIQRDLDFAINNAAIKRSLDVVIRITRGRLPFLVPQAVSRAVPELASVTWLYLIDELENLTDQQQRYVQTLIREKEAPASFIVGSRLYGFRTRGTYSAGEENKEGSEYEPIYLDRLYTQKFHAFRQFCRELVAQRLIEADLAAGPRDQLVKRLDEYFFHYPNTRYGEGELDFVLESKGERRYFAKLRRQLEEHAQADGATAAFIVDQLRVPENALLEKLNVLHLYQAWNKHQDLRDAASTIRDECMTYLEGTGGRGTKRRSSYAEALSKYRNDLVAQLLREYGRDQRYLGVDVFVRMAGGLPRNLVIILKNVVRWAVFNGEVPFGPDPITARSQQHGVMESAGWFFQDAMPIGEEGERVHDAINRLANLFRALRFADKPPESSLSSFSVALESLSIRARDYIRAAEQWSLLLPVERGQIDRNTGGVTAKYQLNPMLAARWDLPIVRRGAIALTGAEAHAIFDPDHQAEFDDVLRARVARAEVPFRERNGKDAQEQLL